ncbi:MAG: DUF4097 family beta strand repeat-containing protein [Flavisolibacter sp.]
MKKYLVLVTFLLQVCIVIGQNKWDKEPYLTKSLGGESIKSVEAKTSGGSISVTGVSASDARIEVYVYPSNSNSSITKEELKQRLEQMYDLDVSVSKGQLIAVAKPKQQIKDWKKALNIAFKIYVTQNVSTELKTSGGSINLTNLTGSQSLSTSGGSLNIDKVNGGIDGKTSGGSIHIQNSTDNIELKTSGGSIVASGCKGNLELKTSGGSLDLSNLSGSVEASTSGGSVEARTIEGEFEARTSGGSIHMWDIKSSLKTSTGGGNIDVEVTQLGKYIEIDNTGGDITLSLPKTKGLDLDLSGKIGETHFGNFDGKIDENSVKGKLNGGGVPVTIKAKSGRIKLQLK